MKIKVLVENTAISKEFKSKHGLSVYLETAKHKILFDLGQDGLFVKNAEKMGVDISSVDTVVISHGHMDHGGGLKDFLRVNKTAKIYIRKCAFDSHFIKVLGLPINVGLDKKLKSNNQIIFTDELVEIDEELTLFSNVKKDGFDTKSNGVLYAKSNGVLVQDDFSHEQNMIVKEDGKTLLLSGCSHAGIVNILSKAEEIVGCKIDTIIGGFHLYNPPTKKYESPELIDALSMALNEKHGKFYTCHCTGAKAFEQMKDTLEDRLCRLSTGAEIEL